METRWIARLLVLSMACGVVLAQARPDFSGQWVMDVERTRAANRSRQAGAGAGGGGAGATAAGGRGAMASSRAGGGASMSPGGMTAGASGAPPALEVRITQAAGSLTIDRLAGQGFDKVVYRLDGAESVSVNGRSTMRLKSRWDGIRLASEGSSETVLSDGSGSLRSAVKEARWIDQDGVLVVETTRTLEGRPPNTSIQYFVRRK